MFSSSDNNLHAYMAEIILCFDIWEKHDKKVNKVFKKNKAQKYTLKLWDSKP